jgi:uncharacterized protein YodC (DUF2158 family)
MLNVILFLLPILIVFLFGCWLTASNRADRAEKKLYDAEWESAKAKGRLSHLNRTLSEKGHYKYHLFDLLKKYTPKDCVPLSLNGKPVDKAVEDSELMPDVISKLQQFDSLQALVEQLELVDKQRESFMGQMHEALAFEKGDLVSFAQLVETAKRLVSEHDRMVKECNGRADSYRKQQSQIGNLQSTVDTMKVEAERQKNRAQCEIDSVKATANRNADTVQRLTKERDELQAQLDAIADAKPIAVGDHVQHTLGGHTMIVISIKNGSAQTEWVENKEVKTGSFKVATLKRMKANSDFVYRKPTIDIAGNLTIRPSAHSNPWYSPYLNPLYASLAIGDDLIPLDLSKDKLTIEKRY